MVWTNFSCSEDGINIYSGSSMSTVSTPLFEIFEKIDFACSKYEDVSLIITQI